MLTSFAASLLLLAAGLALLVAGPVMAVFGLRGRSDIRSELAAQRITFPPRAALPAELARFAELPVTTGKAARAYSSLIRGNLRKATGGRTYSEISGEIIRSGAEDEALEDLRRTAFMGESLRSSLMSAYQAWQLTLLVTALGALFVLVGAALLSLGAAVLP